MKTQPKLQPQRAESTPKQIPSEILNKHYRRPIERPFYKDERSRTTILLGGLTSTHDRLIAASLRNLGIMARALPSTELSSFELGREYGNNGYCNPTYFTVGNLIAFLKDLEKSGLNKTQIVDRYAFLTAGCNAPCRFGLMEIEYRMALKDAGYQGFRVLVFKKEDGLTQSVRGLGIEINPQFFMTLINAINLADIIIGYTNEIRPREVVPGMTDLLKEKAIVKLEKTLEFTSKPRVRELWYKLFKAAGYEKLAKNILVFLHQITSTENCKALNEIAGWFDEIEIDPFRSKTRVKITGELWAGTTEGDGNFNMHKFLEKEGAIVLVEPVATYILFMLHKHLLRHSDRKEVTLEEGITKWWTLKRKFNNRIGYYKKLLVLQLGTKLYSREFNRLAIALKSNLHLVDQNDLQALAHKYYHTHIEGGEGFMEVAKNIYYHNHNKCHMVLSLKPFGCMPSTQSDGVQAAVVEHHKDMIFLPVETSGEGGTNAHNRVLMALADAKYKAKKEVAHAYNSVKHKAEELLEFTRRNNHIRRATYPLPTKAGITSRTARFIFHVDDLLENAG